MNHHHPVRGTFGFLWLFSVVLVLAGCAHAPTSAGSTPTVPAPRASPKPSAAAPCQTQHLLLAFRFCAWKEGVEISPVESSQILGVFI